MITNEIRQKRVREISEDVFSVYTSTELTKAIKQSLLTYQLQNKDAFIELVGDTLIGLRPRNTFEEALLSEVSISAEYASLISKNLKIFFDKAEGIVIPEANLETKERLELRPQVSSGGGASSATTGVPHAGATPLTREELMNALGGKRTMAQDIEAARMKREAAKVSIPTPPSQPAPPTQT